MHRFAVQTSGSAAAPGPLPFSLSLLLPAGAPGPPPRPPPRPPKRTARPGAAATGHPLLRRPGLRGQEGGQKGGGEGMAEVK